MEFFEVVRRRRSIRRFTQDEVPERVMQQAFEAALLAPNSSNAQTWDLFWLRSEEAKAELVKACLSQSAARTARELVVVTADPKQWRRSWPYLVQWVNQVKAPSSVIFYYEKLFPFMYRSGWFNLFGLFKSVGFFLTGIFRPVVRGPCSFAGIQNVCVKSAALAAENFVLAITAQDYASCMMEGFDEFRVKRLLKLRRSSRVVMVIGVGKEAERGTWGPQFRIPKEQVVHEI